MRARVVPVDQFEKRILVGVGIRRSRKNSGSHIDASLSRQPLVKGERLVRYEVNAVMGREAQRKKKSRSL